ncbi:hypothetical protein BOX15_Mlig018003g1, partial [Macrostomum lignano]
AGTMSNSPASTELTARTPDSPASILRTPGSSSRASWFVATPTRVTLPGGAIDVHDVLILTHFAKQPLVDFGRVPVGRLATQRLLIQNPHSYDQEVRISRLPGEKLGITCVEQEFVVNAEGEYMLSLTWTPRRPGGMRELVAFRVGDVYNLQAVLLGSAVPAAATAAGRKRKTWAEQRLVAGQGESANSASQAAEKENLAAAAVHSADTVQSPVFNVAKARLAATVSGAVKCSRRTPALPAQPEESSDSAVAAAADQSAVSKKPRLADISSSASIVSGSSHAGSSLLSQLLHSKLAAKLRPRFHHQQHPSPVERFRRRHSLRRTLTGRFATAATAAAASTAASTSASEAAISSPLSGRVVKRRSTGRAVRRAPRPIVAAAVAESPSSAVSDASDLSNLSMLAPTTPRSTAALASASMADQRSCSVFYDERWREKQEFGLQQWLNYLLTPGLALRCCQGEEQSASATAAAAAAAAAADTTGPAPTKEAVSLRAYADFRTLAALRSRGRRLMTSDSFVSVICRVEREVSEGRLRVRQDVCFRADRGLRARLVDFYLAFHPLWLRLALESLFDQPILTSAAATPSDGSDAGGAAARRTPLRAFILNRVLWSPGLADRFAMPGVCNLYRKGFDAELSKYVLNKFLAIVYFLDRAKTDRLIDFDPCLFTKRSQHKSTKEVVTAFTRDYLSGEGDVIKHLGYMGYRLSHAQKPLDEYQFGVTNLAVDLRDGIRLCRTLEILTGGRTALSGQVRCPAISRLQKIRNCQAAFEALKGLGVSLDWTPGNPIDPRDIVDGHREKTLSLLWRCLARFSLAEDPGLVGRLLCEIRALRRALRTRGAACPPAPADPSPASLLPCWAACVAAFDWPAGRPPPAEDDSRVVMRLLRHYGAAPPAADDNNDGADSWRAVAERLAELGQCPALIMPNSSDRPDRCMLLAQLAALAGSLLNLNAESRAARVIQAAWRRRCASLAGPPAAQEDRVDALPAKVGAESAVFEFNIGVWPGTPGPASKPADTPSRCLLDVQAIRRAQAASAIQRWFRRARQIRIGRIRREIERRRRRRAILVIVTNYQISRRNRFFALLQGHVTRWLANRQAAARRIQQFWRAYRIKRTELERLRAERLERETLAACQIQRVWRNFRAKQLERQRLEQERIEQERLEQERLEQERIEQERLEQERLEQERIVQERIEQERIEQERLEQERLEQERLEQQRLEQERLEQERLEQERLEQQRLEQERLEQERLEQQRLEQERLEQERLEQERLEQERLEQERLEQERLEQERLEQERIEQERLERQSQAASRIQRAWRSLVARRELRDRRTRAAVTLQAAFRGWRVRARCQVAAMPQLRRRISAAYADARRNPERLLLARARSALRFARQQLPAPAVAQQLADLRAGTSHSAKLCELLCSQSGAVAALFSLMAGCNRSLPHQHIVLHSVQILHNLIRHSATAASVARECPVKAGDVLTDALVSGAVVRPSPLQQELVKASACLLASLVSSAAGVSGGFALSRRAVVRLRETRDALLRRAGLEERRLVSQLKASGALLVRVEPDWVLKRSANQHMASPITAVCYLCELLR